jgi:arginyl-tRNA synthetase
MLQADPSRDIVFDINEWISFEGNTGPYLMYAYSRAQSVLSKASEAGHKPWEHADFVTKAALAFEPSEAELLRSIYDFNTVVLDACKQNRPSHLASHLYSMCKNFSRFYADVPILKAADPETIRMRLTLILCFKVTLKQGLSLLGITPPERM